MHETLVALGLMCFSLQNNFSLTTKTLQMPVGRTYLKLVTCHLYVVSFDFCSDHTLNVFRHSDTLDQNTFAPTSV